VESAEALLTETSQEISSVSEERQCLETQVNTLNAKLEVRDAHVALLESQLEERDDVIQIKTNMIDDFQERLLSEEASALETEQKLW